MSSQSGDASAAAPSDRCFASMKFRKNGVPVACGDRKYRSLLAVANSHKFTKIKVSNIYFWLTAIRDVDMISYPDKGKSLSIHQCNQHENLNFARFANNNSAAGFQPERLHQSRRSHWNPIRSYNEKKSVRVLWKWHLMLARYFAKIGHGADTHEATQWFRKWGQHVPGDSYKSGNNCKSRRKCT